MRKSLFSILAVLALAAPAIAADAPRFVLSDGYFQVDGDQPYHLTHGMPPEQKIQLGSGFKFWAGFKLAEGVTSPCTVRDEKPCYFEFRLGLPGADKDKIDDYTETDFRRSNSENGKPLLWNIGYPVTRQATLGHRVLYVRLRYGTTVQYLFAIPLEITE